MAITRHFLGWDAPVTDKVCDWLLPGASDGVVDLSDTLVIVPTRQAGRRLREALALRCAGKNAALIPPRVDVPAFFINRPDAARVAGPMLTASLWCRLLCEINLADYSGLFPHTPRQDPAWALRTTDLIRHLRDTLAEGGHLLRDVARGHAHSLEEPDRWNDLARLETAYLERMEKTGREDRCVHLIKLSETPHLPDGIRRILVAAVPDPSPLMIRALDRLSGTIPVGVLVHAPSSAADDFDAWGRPERDAWKDRPIDMPDADRNLRLGATPVDQARIVLEIIADESARIGPSDLAIGVPDREVAPYVDAHLAEQRLVAFNPAGKPVIQHRLYQALDACRALLADPSYRAVSALLHHPDILSAVEKACGVNSADLLKELDTIQNRHLPQTFADLQERVRVRYPDGTLARVLPFIARLLEAARRGTLEEIIAALMECIYSHQMINPQIAEDDLFRSVAGRINRLTAETRDPSHAALNMRPEETLPILLQSLAGETCYEERQDAQVDLEGWLELPWNNARLLIVTGMNDGMVPDGRLSDVFLPDSLRARLGLRCDADRLARDAYLMTTLIESRRRMGRICFIAGAYSRAGDPLRPSRLLFRCSDDELPGRVARLFREPKPTVLAHPASVSFRLTPPDEYTPLKTVHVTALSGYLACPLRFYFRTILGMKPLTDDKSEMDAADFGTLIHHALQGLAEKPRCGDESELAALFLKRAREQLHEMFGARLPVPVYVQFESVKQRLVAAAAAQARLAGEGWEPRHFELAVQMPLGGMTLTGQMDRLDYHPDLQAWRIIDYKTSDKQVSPHDAHIGIARDSAPAYAVLSEDGKKPRQWCNLQLPLYIHLFRTVEKDASVSAGYFQLPKAVTDTNLVLWGELNEELIASAWSCAEGIARDIEQGRFWPPAEQMKYDDFESLFPFPAAQCIQEWPQEGGKNFLHKDRGGRKKKEER